MDTTTSALLTGVMVAVGQWAQDKKINARLIIAVLILALFLSLMGQSQPKLARQFGALILISATLGFGPSILNKLGYTVSNKGLGAVKR